MSRNLKFCVIGNVDAGKSSLISVLVNKLLDDGRGSARLKMFRHKHEKESGRTSSISNHFLKHTNERVLTFIDLAGHEKYLKTTITGLSSSFADYAILVIGSNMGVLRMTKEHLGIALALKIPIVVVLTKIDMCPEHVLNNTSKKLTRILNSKAAGRKTVFDVKNVEDMNNYNKLKMKEKLQICPVIKVSNKLGTNIDLLRNFLGELQCYDRGKYDDSIIIKLKPHMILLLG